MFWTSWSPCKEVVAHFCTCTMHIFTHIQTGPCTLLHMHNAHICTHADSSLHNLMRSSEWFLVAGSSLRDKTLTHKLPLWQRRKITSGKSVMRQEAFLPAPRLAIRTGGATMMDATLTICPNNTNTTGTKPRCLIPRCAKICPKNTNSGCKNWPKSRRFSILPPQIRNT